MKRRKKMRFFIVYNGQNLQQKEKTGVGSKNGLLNKIFISENIR